MHHKHGIKQYALAKIGQDYGSDTHIIQEAKRFCTLHYFLQGVHSYYTQVILTADIFSMALSQSLHVYGI